jgi:hypothetical protein
MPGLPSRINVLSELERLRVDYKFSGDEEVLIPCAFHDDKNPSCAVNVKTGYFKCHAAGCGIGGDFLKLMVKVSGQSRKDCFEFLSQFYDLGTDELVDPEVIERWHSQIWLAHELLIELKKRAITDDTIRKRRLGEDGGRVIIPIGGKSGHWVTVRKYLPGAPGPEKMKNQTGRGKPRLYPIDQIQYDSIALCGGEIKALAAAQQLNKHNVGAISATAGEGNWDSSFTEEFRGKVVWVIYDVDDEGRDAADKVATHLFNVAREVYVVDLPLDREKHPHGDVNDFIAAGGQLKAVIEATPLWSPVISAPADETPPIDVKFAQAFSAAYTEKRVRIEAVVSAVAESTYILPKRVVPVCGKDQDMCGLCPVKILKIDEFTIPKDSPALLQMVEAPLTALRPATMKACGIPANCPVVSFRSEEHYAAEDVRISPKLEIQSRSFDKAMQQAIVIKDGVQLNENYALVGKQYPHPKTQSATLLVTDFEPVGDALAHYTGGDTEQLKKFQPVEWTTDSVKEKLNGIYADLEANVTRIFQRRRLHLALDLVWHSPLFVHFDGRDVKGWVEGLVVGDSAQGKSDSVAGYLQHYGVGEKVDCKNATVAGLLGGLQKLGGRFFVSWGIIPTHDKRLVILEELKGASTEVISKLTDMRSSGVAEIPKIEKKRTQARTRLLALSNPRFDRPMSSYNYGIEAVKELIGSLEDVRRFDFALALTKDEIDASVINSTDYQRPVVVHEYDSVSCQQLILWSWTREASQVQFDTDAELLTLQRANELCESFTDAIPLVDRASMRYKIARLSASLACRTFSTDDGVVCMVRHCHVDVATDFLREIYDAPSMGYGDFTKSIKAMQTMVDEDAIRARVATVPFAKEFASHLQHASKFDFQDIRDWCGVDRTEAEGILSLLVRKRAIIRMGRGYVKTSPFILLLKGMTDMPEVPPYVQNGDF